MSLRRRLWVLPVPSKEPERQALEVVDPSFFLREKRLLLVGDVRRTDGETLVIIGVRPVPWL
eukprot:16451241-Heterocapsa_arctica.AAC.1